MTVTSPDATGALLSLSPKDNSHDYDKEVPSFANKEFQFWDGTRYAILFLCVLSFTFIRSNDLTFTFSVICMTANNSEETMNSHPVAFSARDLSISFSGVGTGALLSALPVSFLLHRFGGRLVLGTVLILSGTATCLLPSAAMTATAWGIPLWRLVFPIRVIQGIALGSAMPMMGFVSAHWAPLSQIGKFVTLLSSSNQISQIFTMPLSAYLCVHAGWPWPLYSHSVICLICAFVFLFFFRNSPAKHLMVSAKELHHITAGVPETKKRQSGPVPWRRIAISQPIWAVWIAFLGNSVGFQLILQFMPIYLNKVLLVPIERTGFSAIVPPLTQLLVKVLAGFVSDKINFMTERRKVQFFNTLGMCGCGFFLLPLGYLGIYQASLAIGCFTASISSLGLVTCGSMKSVTIVARQYSHFVMSIVQLVVCVGMLTVPFMVSTLAPDNTILQWRSVFNTTACVLVTSNLGFCMLCDAEPAEWTKTSESKVQLTNEDPEKLLAAENGLKS